MAISHVNFRIRSSFFLAASFMSSSRNGPTLIPHNVDARPHFPQAPGRPTLLLYAFNRKIANSGFSLVRWNTAARATIVIDFANLGTDDLLRNWRHQQAH